MLKKAKFGDTVKIETKEEIVIGTLLPRSELLNKKAGKDITVVKLGNGYNIGIDNSKIKKIELIEKYKPLKTESQKATFNKDLAKVLIISCGGTISSKVDYKTGGVYADYTADDFVNMLPELNDVANIDAKKLMDKMSEDFLPEDWQLIAKEIYRNYDKYDGFVITQGTDTMHYTTAALSFFLKNLSKPVIFTAAQRSIDRGSSDAFMNLLCAVKSAAYLDASGVFLCMHGTTNDDYCLIHKGTKVRKMHSLRRDAFRSINSVPIAKINYETHTDMPEADIEILDQSFNARGEIVKKPQLESDFEDKVGFLYFHPNMEPSILDYYLENKYKGLVIAGTALGHVSTSGKKSLLKKLSLFKEKKIPVVMVSQCFYGRVDPLVYSALRELSINQDIIFAEDMLAETAYVKLGWVLSKVQDYHQVKEMMLTNYAGEISSRNHPDCFLV